MASLPRDRSLVNGRLDLVGQHARDMKTERQLPEKMENVNTLLATSGISNTDPVIENRHCS